MLKLMLKPNTDNILLRVLHSAQDQLDMDGCVKYSCDEDIRDIQHLREHRTSTQGGLFQTNG